MKIESSYMTRIRDIDMVREIRSSSLTAKSIPRLIQPLVILKICKKKATCYFAAKAV